MTAAAGLFRIAHRRTARLLRPLLNGLPELDGKRIEVTLRPQLSAWRGKLLSREERGRAIHAASDMRRRTIVLDTQLLDEPAELERIFVHEMFHFVWLRLGNPARRSYEEMVARQFGGAGELGWSAEGLKPSISLADRSGRSRRWREYACESFCDTAAWVHSIRPRNAEWTLGRERREERREWFHRQFAERTLFL